MSAGYLPVSIVTIKENWLPFSMKGSKIRRVVAAALFDILRNERQWPQEDSLDE